MENDIIEICGKRVKIVHDESISSCDNCALQKECYKLKVEDIAPFCEGVDGRRSVRFESAMGRNEIYNKIFSLVANNDGYIAFPTACFIIDDEGMLKCIHACAVYISQDNSSPLWIIDDKFERWDVDDYFIDSQLSRFLSMLENI